MPRRRRYPGRRFKRRARKGSNVKGKRTRYYKVYRGGIRL